MTGAVRCPWFACVLLFVSCAPRALDLSLTFDGSCAVAIPAGGSIFYELVSAGADGGQEPRVCGGCLAVDTAIDDATALVAFLRAQAPACQIAHDVSLTAQVTSFAQSGCASPTAGPATGRLCAASAPVRAGDGRSDDGLAVPLSCAAGCNASTCVPVSCAAQGKNCGSLPDGCGITLDCGTCKPPEKCGGVGGAGVANICAR